MSFLPPNSELDFKGFTIKCSLKEHRYPKFLKGDSVQPVYLELEGRVTDFDPEDWAKVQVNSKPVIRTFNGFMDNQTGTFLITSLMQSRWDEVTDELGKYIKGNFFASSSPSQGNKSNPFG